LIKGERKFLTFLKNRKSMTPIPGVEELLNRLTKAGFVIALASSSPSSIINFILSKCRIENYFKIIMSGDDVEKGKPDPEIFLKTAEKNKTRPENCIVIEDSENGITAANRAGMKSIGYRNPGSGNQNLSGADLIIESFSSLTISDITNLIS
ncbi:MAG: HAD-IA family hydrolase, partial [Spirochaetales bacterium]|nr:HAD-IA family hydrolase [Spirochaetales bacterium]